MFSRRLQWSEPPNILYSTLSALKKEGRRIFDLTESNPTNVGIEYPKEIFEALSSQESLRYNPTPQGLWVARKAVSEYYLRRGQVVDPEQIFLTTSTSEAYGLLFKLLADPGETILVPTPSYPLFSFLAQLESVQLKEYPLYYEGHWRIDTATLCEVAKKAKAIIFVGPNNPTGSLLHQDELATLQRLELPVIADEVFGDYLLQPAPDAVLSLAGQKGLPSFTLSGFSKVLGLPQMKLGWIVVSGPESFVKDACEKLELLLDTYLSVGAPIQYAAPILLSMQPFLSQQILRRVSQNRESLTFLIHQDSPCSLLTVEGGWYAVLRVPNTKSEEEWALRLLQEDSVYVHPGYFFDFEKEAFLVLSLLPGTEIFVEGARRLLHRIEKEY